MLRIGNEDVAITDDFKVKPNDLEAYFMGGKTLV
jgi:hypothetical protein